MRRVEVTPDLSLRRLTTAATVTGSRRAAVAPRNVLVHGTVWGARSLRGWLRG